MKVSDGTEDVATGQTYKILKKYNQDYKPAIQFSTKKWPSVDEQMKKTIISETNRKAQAWDKNENLQYVPIFEEDVETFIGLLFILGAMHSSKETLIML